MYFKQRKVGIMYKMTQIYFMLVPRWPTYYSCKLDEDSLELQMMESSDQEMAFIFCAERGLWGEGQRDGNPQGAEWVRHVT